MDFFCHIGQPNSHDNVFVVKFSKDRDAWSAVMNLYGNDFFHILCMEIDALLHPCGFLHTLRLSDCRVLANVCAILWEVSTAMIGYCAGLVNVKPQLRTPKLPFAVKATFNAMVQASKFVSRCPSDPCAQQALILARKEYRSAVKACKKQVVANRNARYMALSQAKDPQADVYLAKCLRKGKAGLADFISLPDGTRFAQDDVVDGAAAYICSLQDAPLCADLSYRLLVEDSFMQTQAEMRSAVAKNPDEIGLDKDTLRLVLKTIKPTAECRGIPYAALLAESEEHFQFVLLMHKFALTFGVTASVWTMQDLYHSLKPNRAPQCYMSYRALGLNSAQGRLQEEIWAALVPDVWEAAGAFQEGRSQCLAVLAADSCVAALRAARDLPFGMCYCDRKEAFDTQWRASMQQKMVSCVEPRFWCLADELLHTTSMSVVCHGRRSRWFKTGTGVVEGRRLSPLQFCLGQQRLESEAMASLTGVGVNPPLHALVAFHQHKDSTPLGSYDLDEVHMLFNAVQASLMTWDDAMQRVSCDSVRLALIDVSSPVRRNIRSFVDDTRVPVSSHQHAVAAFALLEKVSSEEQYLYKPGKNHIVARFAWREPIQLQGFMVQYVDSTVQLGYSIDHSFDGSSHLHHILARGNGKMIFWLT